MIDVFDEIDDSYWIWHELTMQIVNEHAPIKTKTIKAHGVPYMNGELRRNINIKNMLKRRYERFKNKTNWEKYKHHRNLVTNLRNKSINIYMQNKCNRQNNHSNGKEFWKTIKPLISHKCNGKNDKIILVRNNDVLTQPAFVAEEFNEYFTNIAKHIGSDDSLCEGDNVMTCLIKHEGHESIRSISKYMEQLNLGTKFTFSKYDTYTIEKFLSNLAPGKATGWDLLPSKLLKLGCRSLAPSVCNLVNKSITLCSFPENLKRAEISPIYKKGNVMEVSNYRPVSVLPSISKIFEKAVVSQLNDYFDGIFSDFLSGFRSRHSCETVLLRLTENIRKSLDEGKVVCVLVTDLSRAFDSIPYQLFMAKLYHYGLSHQACQLLLNYYSNRKQRVKIGDIISEWRNVYKGSAQGSIFGPVSYNIFTNDLMLLLDEFVEIYNYADDNTLMCSGYDYKETQNKLVKNAEKVINWFTKNHLKVNTDKFSYIIFGKNVAAENILLNGNIIKPVTDVKILGLSIDNSLNYSKHISNLCQKAGRKIQAIRRLKNVLNEHSKILLFDSFVECYFNYCSVIWHFCSKKDSMKLELLQRKALSMIKNDYKCHYKDLLVEFGKKPLYITRLHKMLEYIFRINHDLFPKYLKDLIEHKIASVDLRSENNICIPKFSTFTYGKHSFRYASAFYWGQLPNDIKGCESLECFKRLVCEFVPKCNCGFCTICNILNL